MPTAFIPASGGKQIVPGCSDKTPRSLFMAEQAASSAVKLTTASRASAALEQYWQQQQGSSNGSSAGNSNHSTGSTSAGHAKKQQDHLPGGERELAHKTRDTCWHDSVQLGHGPDTYVQDCHGTPKDLEEKEMGRTRGIPGYTGCQPPPGASRPPVLPPPGSDERRPWVKGIPGYTGHQPHAAPSGSPSAMTNPQHAAQPQHMTPQSYSEQQVAASAGGGSPAATAGTRDAGSSAGAAAIGQPQRRDAGSPAMVAGYPQTASYYSTAGSRVSSPPRYFCDGVEVSASQVPAPPHSALATAMPQSAASVGYYQYSSGGHSGGGVGSGAFSNASSAGVGPAPCSGNPGSASSAVQRSAQEAQVMVVHPGTAGQQQEANLTLPQPNGGSALTEQHRLQPEGVGVGPSGVPVGARVGRPAVGPWCTTYSSTFVQQEAFKGLMQQFKEVALQRQQQRQQQQQQ